MEMVMERSGKEQKRKCVHVFGYGKATFTTASTFGQK